MTIPTLGTLKEANLREAWPHEAHSFTPWLAQHLDLLAEQICIPLEIEGSEVTVETFSADILARNPSDNTLVLIENQLEVSDHNHLGQIMTYLAGLEANVVIWIAADFREAHLSAVRWLNDHTGDSFSFFAVKIKVVRIDNSPLAPVFEIVGRPNQWARRLQAVAQENQSWTEVMQFRKEFWGHYANKYPEIAQDAVAGVNSNRWRAVKPLNMVISTYIGKKSVSIFIRSDGVTIGTDVYGTLVPFAEELSQRIGAEIGDPNKTYFFSNSYPADTSDRSKWDELVDWLYQKTKTYENALIEIGQSKSYQEQNEIQEGS